MVAEVKTRVLWSETLVSAIELNLLETVYISKKICTFFGSFIAGQNATSKGIHNTNHQRKKSGLAAKIRFETLLCTILVYLHNKIRNVFKMGSNLLIDLNTRQSKKQP